MMLDASLNMPCGIVRSPGKLLAAAMDSAVGIVREMGLALEAIAESSPILAKAFAVLVLAPVDALTNISSHVGKLVKAAMAPAAHLLKEPGMALIAVSEMMPEVWRGLGKMLIADATTIPALDWGNAFLQFMETSLSLQTTIRKRGTKTIIAAVAPAPWLGLAFALMMAAFAATSVRTLLGLAKPLAATLSPAATLFMIPAKVIFAALNTPVDIAKGVFVTLAKKLTATITATKAIRLRRSISVTATPSIRKRAIVSMLAQTALDSALESVMLAKRLLDAGTSIAIGIIKSAWLHLSARQNATPRMTRTMLAARLLEATTIVGVILWKGLWMGMDAALGIAETMEKQARKYLRAALALSTRTLVTYFFVLRAKLTAAIDFRKWRFVPVLLFTSVTQYANMARLRGTIMAASVAVSGTLIRLIAKTMKASTAIKTTIRRCLYKAMEAVSSITAKLGIGAAILLLMEAGLSAMASVSKQKTLKMLIDATVNIFFAVEKAMSKAIFASKRLASSIGKRIYKPLAIALQTLGSLDKALSYLMILAIELPILAEIGSGIERAVVFVATIAARPFKQMEVGKRMAAAIGLLGSLTRHWPMTLVASASLSATTTIRNAARKLYDIARTAWAPLRKRIWKP